MKPIVDVYRLGRTSYAKTLDLQRSLFERLKSSSISWMSPNEFNNNNNNNNDIVNTTSLSKIQSSISVNQRHNNDVQSNQSYIIDRGFQQKHSSLRSSLILVEHEPVYTVGLRTALYDDKYVSKLKHKLEEHKLQAEFYHTDRGGLITFHGPGQLVAYPILNLTEFSHSVKGGSVRVYVNLLESTIIDTLKGMGIPDAHTVKEYPGVWVDNGERKVAFIGITCKRRTTMHGISINCDCDLNWFDFIVSCGIEEKQITSIEKELLRCSSNDRIDLVAGSNIHHESNLKEHNTKCDANIVRSVCSSASELNQITQSNPIESHANVKKVGKEFCQAFSRRFDCTLEDAPAVCNGL